MNITLQRFIASRECGFLRAEDMPELIRLDRLQLVLVRCGGCRFICAAQDVETMIKHVEAGGDYVRDVSFPAWDYKAAQEAVKMSAAGQPNYVDAWTRAATSPEVSGPVAVGLDGKARLTDGQVSELAARRQVIEPLHHFNEADCGGVYDGFGVTSDADSGL